MAIVRAAISGLAPGQRVLPAEASHYLVRVLRLAVGDRFVAFDPAARLEASATILEARPSGVRVEIETPQRAEIVADRELVLVYALAKGDKVDAVVRDAAELGATRIILAQTERAVVRLDRVAVGKKTARWKRVAEQASRQCGRSDPPAIDGVHSWALALARAGDCEARFCLDPRAVEPLGDHLAIGVQAGASIAFAIGPEGGLSSEEIESAIDAGFLPARLGPFILRTETVAAAVLGAVRVLSRT
jgi:16S rRNA (uracil1498-N3)-methyltransferase